jgi:hypothetical protein
LRAGSFFSTQHLWGVPKHGLWPCLRGPDQRRGLQRPVDHLRYAVIRGQVAQSCVCTCWRNSSKGNGDPWSLNLLRNIFLGLWPLTAVCAGSQRLAQLPFRKQRPLILVWAHNSFYCCLVNTGPGADEVLAHSSVCHAVLVKETI